MEWRKVKSLSKYEISESGDVRSTDRTFPAKVDAMGRSIPPVHRKGVPIKPRKHEFGYLMVTLIADDMSRVDRLIHNLVLTAYHGEKPFPDAVCRHLDGDKLNNHCSNLKWGTQQENVTDAVKHGTVPKAENHYGAIRTEKDVRTIRKRVIAGEKMAVVATDFGMSESMCYQIATGIKWASVKGDLYKGRNRKIKRLTSDERAKVLAVRKNESLSLRALAERFGVSKTQIHSIIKQGES